MSLMPLIRGTGSVTQHSMNFVVETKFEEADKIGIYSPHWECIKNQIRTHQTNTHAQPHKIDRANGAVINDK